MSFLDTVRSAIAIPRRIPTSSAAAMVTRDGGRVGKTDVRLFRHWSEHSEWVRAAIDIRKGQAAVAEWDIVASDPDQAVDKLLARDIRDRIEYANPKEDWVDFIQKVTEDVLVLDAGSIEIERNLGGQVEYLHAVDGGAIRVNALWDGDPDEPRYWWYPDGFPRGSWKDADFIYIMETPRTNSPVGLSKLETLKLSIDSELEGHAYNARQVRNAAPDGMLHLGKGARQEQIDAFKVFWAAEQGRGAMAITGGTENPAFVKFHDSNKDAQFLEWQVYLVRKITAVFQLSIQDLNITADTNRSTSETQDSQTEDRGVRPLLSLLGRKLTRGAVQDPQFGGPANNLKFKFTKLNLALSLKQAQYNKLALAGVPWKSVNMALKDAGEEPLGPEYDQLIAMTPQGALALTDLPTMREFMESKKPPPKPLAPGPVAKDDDLVIVDE